MGTGIIYNGWKTIVGANLDLKDTQFKVVCEKDKVYVATLDKEGKFVPILGANANGNFASLSVCLPYDKRSEKSAHSTAIENIVSDVILENTWFENVLSTAKFKSISSKQNISKLAQISNLSGDVLQIIAGQGYKFFQKPRYSVLTNYSPMKGIRENHPFMGHDRYKVADYHLFKATPSFDVQSCFDVLKLTSQKIFPTVVSMVFDATNNIVYWCLYGDFDKVFSQTLTPSSDDDE